MAYFSTGPMYIEMGTHDTDGFNVGFKAHYQVLSADKYSKTASKLMKKTFLKLR